MWFTGLIDEEEAAMDDSHAKFVIKVYSPYLSNEIVEAPDNDSKIELIKSRLNDPFTEEQIQYINNNKILDENSKQYFEIPEDKSITTMKYNPSGTGVIFYLVEENSNSKFVMNRYTEGTHTDQLRKVIAGLEEFKIDDPTTPLDALTWFSQKLNGVIKIGNSVEFKLGTGYGGAITLSYGHLSDPLGNYAFYGSMGGFLSQIKELTILGNPNTNAGENFYILGGIGLTLDLGLTEYEHVRDVAGKIDNFDVDLSVIDVSFETDEYFKYQGIEISFGPGLDAGIGRFGEQTSVFAYTEEDLINALTVLNNIKTLVETHEEMGRDPHIYFNIEANNNQFSLIFNVYDPDEDNIESAEPIETYELLKLAKPYENKPYYSTPNINE